MSPLLFCYTLRYMTDETYSPQDPELFESIDTLLSTDENPAKPVENGPWGLPLQDATLQDKIKNLLGPQTLQDSENIKNKEAELIALKSQIESTIRKLTEKRETTAILQSRDREDRLGQIDQRLESIKRYADSVNNYYNAPRNLSVSDRLTLLDRSIAELEAIVGEIVRFK